MLWDSSMLLYNTHLHIYFITIDVMVELSLWYILILIFIGQYNKHFCKNALPIFIFNVKINSYPQYSFMRVHHCSSIGSYKSHVISLL